MMSDLQFALTHVHTACSHIFRAQLHDSAVLSEMTKELYVLVNGHRRLPEEVLCGAFKSLSASPDKGLRGLLYYLSWNAALDRLGLDNNGEQ